MRGYIRIVPARTLGEKQPNDPMQRARLAMRIYEDYRALVCAAREKRENFTTLLSVVMPRPIAFVSTVSAKPHCQSGAVFLFQWGGIQSPRGHISPRTKADGTSKEALVDLRAAPEVNEFEAAGFTPRPSRCIRPFRVDESLVQFDSVIGPTAPQRRLGLSRSPRAIPVFRRDQTPVTLYDGRTWKRTECGG